MAQSLKWGILATGNIARQFAGGLKASKTGELVAVGSRTLESATAFTEKFGGKPYGSYEEVLQDPEVDAIYIALPHHMHYDWTIKVAEAGKGILCEKPFTLNALEAQRALNVVREKKVFLMEAFMYRCNAQTQKVLELVRSGVIGEVRVINAEFAFQVGYDWQNFRAVGDLGGGGLMDVGAYCVSFARAIAGEEPEVAHYAAKIGEKGYDEWGSGALRFPSGVTCHFGTGVHCNMRNEVVVYGEKGSLVIHNPWKVQEGASITINRNGESPEVLSFGVTNDQLYADEADAVAAFFEAQECPYMSIDDTLGQMRTLDMLRESAGLKFGAEMKG